MTGDKQYNLSNQTRELDAFKPRQPKCGAYERDCASKLPFFSKPFLACPTSSSGSRLRLMCFIALARVKVAGAMAKSRSVDYGCTDIFVTLVFASKETIILLYALLPPSKDLRACTFHVAFLSQS